MARMKDILVPVSPGELLDKITILRIKAARIGDVTKIANVRLELDLLEKTWRDAGCAAFDIARDERALQAVNERLWDIEDLIREKEAKQTFDREFIELARSVTSPTTSAPPSRSGSTSSSGRDWWRRSRTSPMGRARPEAPPGPLIIPQLA